MNSIIDWLNVNDRVFMNKVIFWNKNVMFFNDILAIDWDILAKPFT